jgi:hypothetical protein
LKIAVLATNDDPQSGNTKEELLDIVRQEPDINKFQPPAGYAIKQIEIPAAPR